MTLHKGREGAFGGSDTRMGRCTGVVARGWGKTGTSQTKHWGASWPNNPLELTAHSAGFLGYSRRFLLWAAAQWER
jgi:hypothetical protein